MRISIPSSVLTSLDESKEGVIMVVTFLNISNVALPSAKASAHIEFFAAPGGQHLVVKGLQEPIRFSLPAPSNEGLLCAYWEAGQWSRSGVLTSSESLGSMQITCATHHLSFFGAIFKGVDVGRECADTSSGMSAIFEKDWMSTTGGALYFSVSMVLLCCLLAAAVMDRIRGKTHSFSREFFLIPIHDGPQLKESWSNPQPRGEQERCCSPGGDDNIEAPRDEAEASIQKMSHKMSQRSRLKSLHCCSLLCHVFAGFLGACLVLVHCLKLDGLGYAITDIMSAWREQVAKMLMFCRTSWSHGCSFTACRAKGLVPVGLQVLHQLLTVSWMWATGASLCMSKEVIAFILEDKDLHGYLQKVVPPLQCAAVPFSAEKAESPRSWEWSPRDRSPRVWNQESPRQAESGLKDTRRVGWPDVGPLQRVSQVQPSFSELEVADDVPVPQLIRTAAHEEDAEPGQTSNGPASQPMRLRGSAVQGMTIDQAEDGPLEGAALPPSSAEASKDHSTTTPRSTWMQQMADNDSGLQQEWAPRSSRTTIQLGDEDAPKAQTVRTGADKKVLRGSFRSRKQHFGEPCRPRRASKRSSWRQHQVEEEQMPWDESIWADAMFPELIRPDSEAGETSDEELPGVEEVSDHTEEHARPEAEQADDQAIMSDGDFAASTEDPMLCVQQHQPSFPQLNDELPAWPSACFDDFQVSTRVHAALPKGKSWKKCSTREEAWLALADEVQSTFRGSADWPRPSLWAYLSAGPLGSILSVSLFVSCKLRALYFMAELMGCLMFTCAFFLAAEKLTKGSCGMAATQDEVGFQTGRVLAVVLASFLLARLTVRLLKSFRTVRLRRFEYEGCPHWERQLQAWRMQDGVAWTVGSVYVLFCLLQVASFLSRIPENAELQEQFTVAGCIFILLEIVIIPAAETVCLPMLVALLLSCNRKFGHAERLALADAVVAGAK